MNHRFDAEQRDTLEGLGIVMTYLGYAFFAYAVPLLLQLNLCGVVLQVILGVLMVRAGKRVKEASMEGLLEGLDQLSVFVLVRIVTSTLLVVTVAVLMGAFGYVMSDSTLMSDEVQQGLEQTNNDVQALEQQLRDIRGED